MSTQLQFLSVFPRLKQRLMLARQNTREMMRVWHVLNMLIAFFDMYILVYMPNRELRLFGQTEVLWKMSQRDGVLMSCQVSLTNIWETLGQP